MKCPSCSTELKMSERNNIEIDYCPQCRGVWLDRGELDKIIERASSENRNPEKQKHDYDDDYKKHKSYDDGKYYKHKKKESFLGDLFDF